MHMRTLTHGDWRKESNASGTFAPSSTPSKARVSSLTSTLRRICRSGRHPSELGWLGHRPTEKERERATGAGQLPTGTTRCWDWTIGSRYLGSITRRLAMSRCSRASLVVVLILWQPPSDAEPNADSSAHFLQSVISRMQNEKYINYAEDLVEDYRPTPPSYHDVVETVAPPLSKGELLALYQASVAASTGINISATPPLPLSNENNHHQDELVAPAEQGILNGYYYYYYPIKSFLNTTSDDPDQAMMTNTSTHDMMMMMMSDAGMMDENKDMTIDPLFLATAGFVTMATIISVGILFLPKFGSDRSWKKAVLKNLPEEEDGMFSLTRVIGQAIQGKDCAERLACELGHAIRNMKLGQKPLKVLEAMLPRPLAQQMSQVRQHVVKKEKCQFIPCKWRKPDNKQNKKPQRQTKPQFNLS